MPITRTRLAIFAVVALAACQSGGPGPSTAPAQPMATPAGDPATGSNAGRSDEPTTADGIYTATQADRGKELYRDVCSECHDTTDWTESGFQGRWEGESTYQLWYYINDRMPYDDPFSLSRQQVTDMLAYILQLNGLPAGSDELATDDDSIDDYWIVWNAAN